jgi:geranylgeranyl diphosphate synthase type I
MPWLEGVQQGIDQKLSELLASMEDEGGETRWSRALGEVRAFARRPAKRIRPALLLLGHAVASGSGEVSPGLWQFAAAVELLHTFLLVHDDVADRAALRRGGPPLHRRLGSGRVGENLAVVVGDYLFTRAVEALFSTDHPRASIAARYYLAVCRQTAVGQFLDLELASAPLSEVTLFQTLRVAQLKTARYGFVAPLVCGARLAGAQEPLVECLERLGRGWGLAYQMQDDLLGLFGDAEVSGKDGGGDFGQRKRTFPVVAAYARAPHGARGELAKLWEGKEQGPAALARARELVRAYGGDAATTRVIGRSTRAARRALWGLPHAGGWRDLLDGLLQGLERRGA